MIIEGQQAVCFVRREDMFQFSEHLLRDWPTLQRAEIALETFNFEPTDALYFDSLKSYQAFRTWAQHHKLELLEDDIRPIDRFLMERFIQGGITFDGVEQSTNNSSYSRYKQVQIKSTEMPETHLSFLSVDIECNEYGELLSIGLCGAPDEQIEHVLYNSSGINTSVELSDRLHYVEWLTDEKALLQRFNQLLFEYQPDAIVGWNFVSFDVRLLVRAAKRHRVVLNWGRDGSELNFISGRRGENNYPDKAYAAGRVILDGIDVMKNATYHFDSFSLNSVASELLGEKKLIESSSGLDKLAEIKRQYREEPERLAAYNLQDCLLVAKIFSQERLLEFLLTRARLTGLDLDRVGGSVAAFTNLYLPRAHRKGFVAPNLVAPEDYLHSPGGFVMDSTPGLFQDVLVFDFKSLYPSIIRTFNVDPIAMVQAEKLSDEKIIKGFRSGKFSREKSLLSFILDDLWSAREKAKRENNKIWSNAIKIIMNSFYGVLGSSGCRFYDTKLASSITMRGHWILIQSKLWFEEKGLSVIYGDTDSIFVCLDGSGKDASVATELERQLNAWWQQKLTDEFDIECKLEMEFESHFSPFFMPTIRGAESGSKKRYAGLKVNESADKSEKELVFKGLESVRSDWTEIAKQFQRKLYLKVFSGEPVDGLITETLNQLYEGELDELLVYSKRIRQPLEHYVKTTPPQIKAARRANQLLGTNEYKKGSRIRYVMSTSGPETLECKPQLLDYQHYVEKQLFPIAQAILSIYSPNSLSLFEQQMSLL